eukprot:2794109-Rhodomonas_salina.1
MATSNPATSNPSDGFPGLNPSDGPGEPPAPPTRGPLTVGYPGTSGSTVEALPRTLIPCARSIMIRVWYKSEFRGTNPGPLQPGLNFESSEFSRGSGSDSDGGGV